MIVVVDPEGADGRKVEIDWPGQRPTVLGLALLLRFFFRRESQLSRAKKEFLKNAFI